MFQNLLAWILKEIWPLFITSIALSKALDVHLPCVNNARTQFVLTNLLISCVGVVGGMFSLSIVAYSYKPFRCLWGTFNIMVAPTCFLALASSNLVGVDQDLQRGINFSLMYASQNFKKIVRFAYFRNAWLSKHSFEEIIA